MSSPAFRPHAVCRRSRWNPQYSLSSSSSVVPPFLTARLSSKRAVADRISVPLVWPLWRGVPIRPRRSQLWIPYTMPFASQSCLTHIRTHQGGHLLIPWRWPTTFRYIPPPTGQSCSLFSVIIFMEGFFSPVKSIQSFLTFCKEFFSPLNHHVSQWTSNSETMNCIL